jgi:hypothetical protein
MMDFNDIAKKFAAGKLSIVSIKKQDPTQPMGKNFFNDCETTDCTDTVIAITDLSKNFAGVLVIGALIPEKYGLKLYKTWPCFTGAGMFLSIEDSLPFSVENTKYPTDLKNYVFKTEPETTEDDIKEDVEEDNSEDTNSGVLFDYYQERGCLL